MLGYRTHHGKRYYGAGATAYVCVWVGDLFRRSMACLKRQTKLFIIIIFFNFLVFGWFLKQKRTWWMEKMKTFTLIWPTKFFSFCPVVFYSLLVNFFSKNDIDYKNMVLLLLLLFFVFLSFSPFYSWSVSFWSSSSSLQLSSLCRLCWPLSLSLYAILLQRWRSLRVEIEHESHSAPQRPGGVAAAGHLQVGLWHWRWIFPVGYTDLFSQTRDVDVRGLPGPHN
jgi:hypothetical protein